VHHVHRHGLLSAKMAILLRVHFNRRVGETAGDSLEFLFAVVIDGVIEDAVLRFEGTYADKAGAVNEDIVLPAVLSDVTETAFFVPLLDESSFRHVVSYK